MDRGWADWLLRQACDHAGVEAEGFVYNVMQGLSIGANRYGEFQYRGRDNAREGLEEARDAAAYALMELADMEDEVRAGRLDEHASGNARLHLLNALALAAQMDTAFRLAKHARRD